MTTRHAGYLIVLEDDLREDDAEISVLNAIRMVRGVLSVVPVEAGYEHVIARQRRDRQWQDALRKLEQDGPPG